MFPDWIQNSLTDPDRAYIAKGRSAILLATVLHLAVATAFAEVCPKPSDLFAAVLELSHPLNDRALAPWA
jgi:hypothetical protein